ncbi:hypothetical protein BDR07DRAFT_1206520, partial [Suillus spraguei]
DHTVFKAEMVGLTLAAKLIANEWNLTSPLSILVDNQAAILSSESFYTNPGSYLVAKFQKIIRKIKHANPNFKLMLRWVPGHEGVHGNEEADKAAKVAAEGRNRNSPHELLPKYLRNNLLPLSLSAIKQAHRECTHARWAK